MNKFWDAVLVGVICLFLVFVMYVFIKGGKFLTYKFFYEDQVIQTIKETIKPEYLK